MLHRIGLFPVLAVKYLCFLMGYIFGAVSLAS